MDPFLKVLRNRVAPDFGINFAYEGLRKNDGLAYMHRKVGDRDFYYICNIQNKVSTIPVTFRVKNKNVRKWDPLTGKIETIFSFKENADGIQVPLAMAPWESFFLEFAPGEPDRYITETDFQSIQGCTATTVVAATGSNGRFLTTVKSSSGDKVYATDVSGVPAPFAISGKWEMKLEDSYSPVFQKTIERLTSWSDDPATKTFSGTGIYSIEFMLPPEYLARDLKLFLDPGKVCNIAEIALNGTKKGVTWISGQQCEVTGSLKEGLNKLQIKVTNTLINRIAAMKEPSPVPGYMVAKFGTQASQGGIPREFGFSPLPAAGLMGPVRLVAVKNVEIPL